MNSANWLTLVIVWFFLFVFLMAAFSAINRSKRNKNTTPKSRPGATDLTIELDMLDERYARGEISQREYETRKRELIENRRYIA